MTAWPNEAVIKFLEYYEREPCIWNPNDINHKDKKKVAAAWNRLSETLNISVKELKHKKEILMVIFRKHLKKKVNSMSLGIESMYEPVWFAYQTMERFLLPVYSNKNNITIEMPPCIKLKEVFEEIANDAEGVENVLLVPDDNNNRTPPSTSINSLSSKRKSRRSAPVFKEEKITPTISQLTNTSNYNFEQPSEPSDYDECDMYASLLARKLRDLSSDERKIFMYEIDGLFVERVYKKRCTSEITFS